MKNVAKTETNSVYVVSIVVFEAKLSELFVGWASTILSVVSLSIAIVCDGGDMQQSVSKRRAWRTKITNCLRLGFGIGSFGS